MENYPIFRLAMLHFEVCTKVLLTRSPLTQLPTLNLQLRIKIFLIENYLSFYLLEVKSWQLRSLDLHALSTPPAFILS